LFRSITSRNSDEWMKREIFPNKSFRNSCTYQTWRAD